MRPFTRILAVRLAVITLLALAASGCDFEFRARGDVPFAGVQKIHVTYHRP
jgi:hypothetical protein